MNNSTAPYLFKLIKHHIEEQLDRNSWRWSTGDSILLDWCVWNMEATNDK
jgi:hypothetical protein